MLRAYKYRIYPNKEQAIRLDKNFGACRFIYNLALETKNWAYLSHKKNLTGFDLMNQLPELKKENLWLKEADSHSLQQAIVDMEKAFVAFFKGSAEFPNFKKKNARKSFRNPIGTETRIEKGRLYQPKFQEGIKVVVDRPYKGIIKSTTISKTPTGKYYVSVLCETSQPKPESNPIKEDTSIGIDSGLKSYLITSEGHKVDNPRFLQESIDRLRVLQRRIKNKKKGSNKWKNANKQIALLHERIAFQRRDFLHKLSKQLVNSHDTLCFETLQVSNMSKRCKPKKDENGKFIPNGQSAKSGLNKSIQDAAWSMFVEFCTYKADWNGKNILQIPTFEPSSKMCSCCGNVKKDLTLTDREWTCDNCHTKHDRDVNAAINIKAFALKKLFVEETSTRKHSRRATPGVPLELPTLVGTAKRENIKQV